MLTEDHKLQRVEISGRLVLRCQQDNGDEDMTYIETKRDSMTWKHPSSPVTKKFKVQRSAAKVIATVFWGAKGVILLDILPQGQCINAAQYCSTLDRLRDPIRRKRPGLFSTIMRPIIQQTLHSN
ncbi:histone-lysine N-methyltransferase SETMAR [Elysia marginata]|uniref:Histone-lysine N-methyltransferase SETMAR n=1 Tax=Elysia marginata TaxID=1093978 RepID=A0AAV4IYA5_9GAST|nr:histone-lysine N-methyltransferase SETMAR [Elysia marginata]